MEYWVYARSRTTGEGRLVWTTTNESDARSERKYREDMNGLRREGIEDEYIVKTLVGGAVSTIIPRDDDEVEDVETILVVKQLELFRRPKANRKSYRFLIAEARRLGEEADRLEEAWEESYGQLLTDEEYTRLSDELDLAFERAGRAEEAAREAERALFAKGWD